MLCFSFRIPEGGDRGPVVVVLILEKENLGRMRQGDPVDIQFNKYGAGMPIDSPLKRVDLVVAYEEDLTAVMRFYQQQDLAGLLDYLERGRKIIPGDVAPPVLLRKN